MSSTRQVDPVAGSAPRPDVLTESTDLDTLYHAILGDKRPRVLEPPPARSELEIFTSHRTAIPAPPIAEPILREPFRPVDIHYEPVAVSTASPDEREAFEPEADSHPVRRLRLVRLSPWPVMIVVTGMALVTVSAIGLRNGASSAKVEPPLVGSPPVTLPSAYSALLPAAPLTPVDSAIAPPSTAFGDYGSPRPASAPANLAPGAVVPAAASPNGRAAAPAAAAAPRLDAAPTAATSARVEAATSARVDTPPVEAKPEPARPPEPSPPPAETRTESAGSTRAPAAIAPASPPVEAPVAAVSVIVPELPKPAATSAVAPITPARRLTGGMPEYSAALRQQRIAGVVEVRLTVDSIGRVTSARATSGPAPLRQAAETAVLKWRFAPATRSGAPIDTEINVSFSFDPTPRRRP